MNILLSIWNESSAQRRGLFVALMLILLGLLAWAAYAVLVPSYQVLFRDLRPQDAAAITSELDKQKIKYQLDAGGATILVPEAQVHSARLKVLGKDLPLSGTVGFELFNNADLGLTEFAQKVNYQRALQGELARTLMSLEDVQSARVHLSLPEGGYLRRAGSKPKASVAISPKVSGPLDKSTVRSIQRLVAAAVPDLELSDVAVINQSLVHVQSESAQIATVSADPRLEQKFELEEHYVRRIAAQADRIFGPGRTQVNVDIGLNFDQTKVMNESSSSTATPTRDDTPAEGAPARDASLSDRPATAQAVEAASTADRVGKANAPRLLRQSAQRRVEETTLASGVVRRVSVAALISGKVDKAELDRFKTLVASLVGLESDRGDSVAIFNVDTPSVPQEGAAHLAPLAAAPTASASMPEASGALGGNSSLTRSETLAAGLLLSGLVAVIVWAWRSQFARPGVKTSPVALTDAQRAHIIERLSEVLQEKVVRS